MGWLICKSSVAETFTAVDVGKDSGMPYPVAQQEVARINRLIAQEPTAIGLIAQEREKQRQRWGDEHDDKHTNGELAIAAACYAVDKTHAMVIGETESGVRDAWPFEPEADNRQSYPRERALVVAAAFLVAEIERLRRRAKKRSRIGEGVVVSDR